MSQELKTLELARIYESQGYYKDAFEIYSFLNIKTSSDEIKAGLKRMEKRLENKGQKMYSKENLFRLFEKWMILMVLEHRLDNLKKIKLHQV
ncbi:MAG: hypothetical protein JRC91_09750 [Deltaproteobacteria bacterium]|nr:hypothetical protein [Deltaproteobacteria bacterium]